MDELKRFFRPEFLNRFNGIVEFTHLDKQALKDIINLLLDDVQVTLDKKISLCMFPKKQNLG